MRADGPTLPLPDGFPVDCPHGHGAFDLSAQTPGGGAYGAAPWHTVSFTTRADGGGAVTFQTPWTVRGWCPECDYTAEAETPDHGAGVAIFDPLTDPTTEGGGA